MLLAVFLIHNKKMYLDHKIIREFEESNGYKTIIDKNIQIGKFLGFEPEIEWMVGTDDSSCFRPKSCGYNDSGSQKIIAEKWLNEQKEKYPNGWVIAEGNQVVKREYFPNFHTDWNHLMECVKRLKLLGIEINIFSDKIFQTWDEVAFSCCRKYKTNFNLKNYENKYKQFIK
jgi:hypothetical protein